MVDTHAHLGLCEPSPQQLLSGAEEAGVNRILTIGLGEDSNPGVVELAEQHQPVFACVGRHPNGADGFDDAAAAAIEELAGREEGRVGLDQQALLGNQRGRLAQVPGPRIGDVARE